MSAAKALYHRLIPAGIRNPFGRVRRSAADFISRNLRRNAPPRELLERTSGSPFLADYELRAKRQGAAIVQALDLAGISRSGSADVFIVSFGTGELLQSLRKTSWSLQAYDRDDEISRWTRSSVAGAQYLASIPSTGAMFDAIVCLDLPQRHLPEKAGFALMAPLLRPNGILVLATTTQGPTAAPVMQRIGNEYELLFWSEQGFEPGIDLAAARKRA